MQILNSTIADIDEIFRLYHLATEYQKTQFWFHWPPFDRTMVEIEIQENRQWKIIIDDQIACVWATTFDDPKIWGIKNEDPAIYIHRISTNPIFRGQNFVQTIVDWARIHAQQHQKTFIRMDTIAGNERLNAHYCKCGFDHIGLFKMEDSEGLPAHYHNATLSLFEIILNK